MKHLILILSLWFVHVTFSQTIFELEYSHYGRMGQATVLFDMNSDSLLDFATANKGSLFVVQNLGGGSFSNHSGYAVDVVNGFGSHDFDLDGNLDISLAQRPGSVLDSWLNSGGASFTPSDLGNESVGATRNVVYSDFDGDGYIDSYHSASAFGFLRDGNQLHPGDGVASFSDDIVETILDPPIADFWYDSVDHPTLGMQYWSAIQSKGSIVRDLDGDGRGEIINAVYCDLGFQPDSFTTDWVNQQRRGIFILQNNSTPGTFSFEDVSHDALGADAYGSDSTFWNPYGCVALDYDHDGDYDLMVGANTRQQEDTDLIRFYENQSTPGNIYFIEKTTEVGLQYINDLSVGTKRQLNLAAGAPIDYNNDTWVDVIFVNRKDGVSTFAPYALVFINNGDNTFSLIDFEDHGLGGISGGRDINSADLDGDGKIDVIISDGTVGGYEGTDSTLVYLNDNPDSNNWIQLDIKTSETESWAFEYTVKVYECGSSELIGMEDIRTDFCYRSKRYPILHFGLGDNDSVDLEILGSDTIYNLNGLPANEVHRIYLDEILTITNESFTIPKAFALSTHPNPFNSAVTISIDIPVGDGSPVPNKAGEETSPLRIEIFDVNGRRVAQLPSPSVPLPEGEGGNSFSHWEKVAEGRMMAFTWQPSPSLTSGVYLVRATVGEQSTSKKIIYLK